MRKLTTPFIGLSAGMLFIAPWIINAAPYESTMGLVQKVFYFHFPAAILFLMSAIICGIASLRFLFFKKASADANIGATSSRRTCVRRPIWSRSSRIPAAPKSSITPASTWRC